MKNRFIAVLLAAFFLLSTLGLAAYAAEPEYVPEDEYIIEYTNDPDEAVLTEHPDIDAVEIKYAPYEEKPYVVELPPLPPGTGTIIDFNSDPMGRLFFTIMADDEHVFYLVVDTTSNVHNVYFLNAVTVADLLPLAQEPAPLTSDTVSPPPTISADTEQVVEVPISPPLPEEEPQRSGGNISTIIIIIITLIGGGAGWYFKIYRPKQQRMTDCNEYDPDMDDIESEYTDKDWSEEEQRHHEVEDDTPPWGDDEYE